MQLIANGNTLTIDNPHYGYNVEYHMSILINELHSAYKVFDNGIIYDSRMLKTAKHWLTEANEALLEEYFADSLSHRCEEITLSLGATPTGFYPAGPDKGDVGDFTVRLLDDIEQTGILTYPFRNFAPQLNFVIVSAPAYSMPALETEGNITIGSLTNGFRFPQRGFNPYRRHAKLQVHTLDNTQYNIDLGGSADITTSEFKIETCSGNMGRLLELLYGRRGTATTLTVDEKHYPFGALNTTSTDYSVTCINTVFKMKHEKFNYWSLPLKFWFNGYV